MAADLKPIRTETDYEAALAEAERLWGAKSGTPKGDRLDVLATLIEAFEAKQYPMDHRRPAHLRVQGEIPDVDPRSRLGVGETGSAVLRGRHQAGARGLGGGRHSRIRDVRGGRAVLRPAAGRDASTRTAATSARRPEHVIDSDFDKSKALQSGV
ncbi:MAG: hypothetical protein ABSA13_15390 [Beijerinckiaceae bacterium]|jgi:hypothetical protein